MFDAFLSGTSGVGRSMPSSRDRLTLHSRVSRKPITARASLACDRLRECTGHIANKTVHRQVLSVSSCNLLSFGHLRSSGMLSSVDWKLPTFRDNLLVTCSWILLGVLDL
jgi:hypothetical protein